MKRNKKRGAHFAVKGKSLSFGDTREFALPRKHRFASYFFFTLFICALLVTLAIMILSVDFFGRSTFEKTDATLTLAISESGQAKLSLLGKEYTADVSFLTPLSDTLCEGLEIIEKATPKCIVLFFEGVPEMYDKISRQIGEAGAKIGEKLSSR